MTTAHRAGIRRAESIDKGHALGVTESPPQLFDRLAGGYDDVVPVFAEIGRQLIEWLDPPPGTRLLDIGAGRGAVAAAAVAQGCRVTAVDAAPAMVARLAAEHPQVDASVMDIHQLDFDDDLFDMVTAGFVLHIVDEPVAVARQAHRVLAPGGSFAVSVPAAPAEESGWDFYPRLIAEFEQFSQRDRRPFRAPPSASRDALTAAGFVELVEARAEVRFTLPDAGTYWRWMLSHGAFGFVASLPPDRRAQMRQRVIDEVTAMDEPTLHRGAVLLRGRKAGREERGVDAA